MVFFHHIWFMKNNILIAALLVLALASCKSEQLIPASKFDTTEVPDGINLGNFRETYNKSTNTYDLSFTVKNNSGNDINLPMITGEMIIHNAIAGVGKKSIDKISNGATEETTISSVLPIKPSRVVIHFEEAPLYGLQF